jgi:DNA invertase Pin-like site-specific DNA recombinase
MYIGYARVSTTEQTLALQQDALRAADCELVFTDTQSGVTTERPGLSQALLHLRTGDTLVVWRLDRLGRSLKHLIETVTRLQAQGIGFKSLTESIDTTTPGGVLIFHVFGALAQFERDLIRERTRAGLTAARARGKQGGRPKALSKIDPKKLETAQRMAQDPRTPISQICEFLGVSRWTVYRYLPRPQASVAEQETAQEVQ